MHMEIIDVVGNNGARGTGRSSMRFVVITALLIGRVFGTADFGCPSL